MDIKKIIQEVVWNPDFKNSMITDKDIIGKKVSDAFQGYDGIELIANKTIAYAKLFQGGGHIFEGIENADDFLETEGYIRGRMMEQGNFPVPFVKKGKLKRERFPLTGAMLDVIPTKTGENEFLYDTYWDMLDVNAINLLDGVLLSEDYDYKEIHAIFFEFPMNEGKKKKKKQLTMALPIGKIFTAGGTIGENEMKSHIMTREEFTKIVNEELNKLNEQHQILNLRDLAELGSRTGYDFETFLQIYQEAFRRGGDEEVVKVAESMLRQKVYILSKGKYSLTPLTGGEY